MSTSDPRHYEVILSPVITEKATLASEHGQVMFKVARGATKPPKSVRLCLLTFQSARRAFARRDGGVALCLPRRSLRHLQREGTKFQRNRPG